MIVETTLTAGRDAMFTPNSFTRVVGRRIPHPSAWAEDRVEALVVAATVAPDGQTCVLRLDLDGPKIDDPRAQVGRFHPDTSHAAAAKAIGKSGSDRRRVYEFVALQGDDGATDDQIEESLRMAHQTASARRNGLAGDGWLRDSGRKRPTRSGAPAIVWVAVPEWSR